MFGLEESTSKTMKRSRWMTTAMVAIAAMLVDMESSAAFSPDSPKITSKKAVLKATGRASVSLNVAMSSVYEPHSGVHAEEYPRTVEIFSLPSSSRSTALGKRIRKSKIKRPSSRNGSIRSGRKSNSKERKGLLSKEEERTLTLKVRSLRQAVRIRDELALNSHDYSHTEAGWAAACGLSIIGLRRVMYEGQQARTILVSSNAGLVTSIAKRHYRSLKQATEAGGGVGTILTLQDMIQEGNLGLMQAAERFEPERGWRFSTYATYWIKQRILRSISDSSRIIRLPAHVHAMLQKVNRAKRDMIQEIGRAPSVPELAHYIQMSVDELTKLTSRSRNVVSLEVPINSGGSMKEDTRTIGDFIVSDAPTPEEDAQSKYLKHDIRAVIDELQPHERDVVILRFGLENGNPMNINQTSKRLGISCDRVRNVEARALAKLRSPQRNYRLKEYLSVQEEEIQPSEEVHPTPEKMWFF
eukprot:scaffold7344_cov145-Cylindrotheca_fusiformis.AAC.4